MTTAISLTLACCAAPLVADAQESERPNLSIGRASDARPIIDGVVNDEVWNSVSPFTTFIQQEPNEGEPATERTEIRFLLDRRDTSSFTPEERLGRSFVAKYTRLFNF